MPETQLSSRQAQAVVVTIVMAMGALMAYVFTVLPSNDDPVGSRRWAGACGVVAALAAIWLIKLAADAVRDRRRGIVRGPAQVSGGFSIVFGALVLIGGVACSAVTYSSAVAAGGGVWTMYYGMIFWGIGQMIHGWRKRARERGGGVRGEGLGSRKGLNSRPQTPDPRPQTLNPTPSPFPFTRSSPR